MTSDTYAIICYYFSNMKKEYRYESVEKRLGNMHKALGSIPSVHQAKKCCKNRQILWLRHLL